MIDLSPWLDEVRTEGFCVIPEVFSADVADRLTGQLEAVAASEVQQADAWFSHANQRVFMLLNKGDDFLPLIDHPVALGLADGLLDGACLLSSITANIARPQNTAQPLHADQGYIAQPWLRAEAINIAWLLDDFTTENGATRIVPKTHLIGAAPESSMPTCSVVARRGSLLCMDGRLWHGSGVNLTQGRRRAIFAYYCRPYIRQQENFVRSLHPRIRGKLNAEQQRLLGYDVWQGLGAVNGLPLAWMDGRERIGPGNDEFVLHGRA